MPMKGMKAENRVAASLRRTGASVEKSPGSRTSADMTAKWSPGKEWLVQVKYSGKGVPSSLKSHERKALIARAKRNNATPVVAKVTPEKIQYESARDGRQLKP
jgi:Holliday junction resolvase